MTMCMLRGNPKELDSIFTNLVVNAVNYTPEKGRIRICWYADEAGAHFEVHDTGTGIASHHLHRLTERFYRVDLARSRATGGPVWGWLLSNMPCNKIRENYVSRVNWAG